MPRRPGALWPTATRTSLLWPTPSPRRTESTRLPGARNTQVQNRPHPDLEATVTAANLAPRQPPSRSSGRPWPLFPRSPRQRLTHLASRGAGPRRVTLPRGDSSTPGARTLRRGKSEKPAPWEAHAAVAVCPFRQAPPCQVYGPTKHRRKP